MAEDLIRKSAVIRHYAMETKMGNEFNLYTTVVNTMIFYPQNV